jgi:Cytochrome C'
MALLLVVSDYSAFGQAGSKKRAAPPKFKPEEVEDIFFKDARTALVGKRPARNVATSTTTKPNDLPATSTNPPANGGIAWSKLISPETLADEVKSYSSLLSQVVKTPGQFKGNGARSARRYFSTLAAVFAMIADFDGDVRWKNQAAAARQLFARAGFNSKSDNDNVYNEAKLRVDDLTSLIRGETIAAPPNIEPSPSFNEQVANRPPLMWRLERAQQDRLAVWTSNAGEFNKNLDGIRHEAEMVAALAEVIQHKSYTDADSETYIEYAKALQQSAVSIREAAKQKNADAARTAAGNLKKACDNCHGDFRGN